MFDHVLEPYDLAGLKLRNRVVTTAYVTNFAPDHLPTDQHVAHYGDLARGGVGMIVMAFLAVHPTVAHVNLEIHGWKREIIPGLERIAEEVHAHGARLICQLGHTGRQGTSAFSDRELWAASAIPCPRTRQMPKAMEEADIAEVVEAHAAAARMIEESGADGVEIHSGYGGYLLSGFISPYMNHRDDGYGGELENRMRFPLEVAAAVRGAVADGFVVGMQTNGDDLAPGGLGVEGWTEVAVRLAGSGSLDYLTVKGGTYLNADLNIPDWQQPAALWLGPTRQIKAAVGDFPVIAVGRVTDPEQADEIVRTGAADLVGMTRQHLSDPQTVEKMRTGASADIRRCVACNQGCIDNVAKGRHITCIHNPAAGYERELGIGTLVPAATGRRVVVVGGGPAGLKAAETARLRGHQVTLLEGRAELGGQVRWATSLAAVAELAGVTEHLIRRVEELGVDVRTGVEAGVATVEELAPESVVVATGSAPTREGIGLRSFGLPGLQGADSELVMDLGDYFEGTRSASGKVVVVHEGEPGWKALAVTMALAEGGLETTLMTPLPFAAGGLGPFSAGTAMRRLEDLGVRTMPFSIAEAVTVEGVSYRRMGAAGLVEAADTVVLAGWFRPEEDLYFALKERLGADVHRIGDAVASRTILEAVHEAERLMRTI
jgi:2,4-dienoyl-CoA reductase-like NADH-dependent reductase (Old Yellow Enzyme family)